ncbi:DUF1289 domain-containing protein [Xylophilus sp. GOD-11R]|uniref:DUF1289 domain-containing protein n=1 Tax=Xylophilus sp. GOD-11R TaxID=3089814 RepID=UPI00298CB9C6|nr:DUF1289 domain-containing protein [Xylophilus sp. GOD-11R]WPB57968.1 DUF1289 domain-containing protein [Xylophilus sp. GOD-11R]
MTATELPARPVAWSPEALALLAGRSRSAFDESVTPVPSPCISICRMNDDRSLCQGCMRSLDEIRAWSTADAAARRAIWRLLLARAGIAST